MKAVRGHFCFSTVCDMKNVSIVARCKWIRQPNKGFKIICNKETNKTISSAILDILARHAQQYAQVYTIDIDN